jgi:hypothetical protein
MKNVNDIKNEEKNTSNKNKRVFNISYDLNITGIGLCLSEKIGNTLNFIKLLVVEMKDVNNDSYKKGTSFKTQSSIRRQYRSMRKRILHKKQVKKNLLTFLNNIGIVEDVKIFFSHNILHNKCNGLKEKLSLSELRAVLYNYAVYRGYSEIDEAIDDGDSNEDKEKLSFKDRIENFKKLVKNSGLTVSQYKIKNHIRVHDINNIVDSSLHLDELKKILNFQSQFYPQILTKTNINKIIKKIYYRNNPKSYRHLIGNSKNEYYKKDNNKYYKKVALTSEPSYEEFICWCQLHNLKYSFIGNKNILLTNDDKLYIFENICKKYDKISKDSLAKELFNYFFEINKQKQCVYKNTGEIIFDNTKSKTILKDISFQFNMDLVGMKLSNSINKILTNHNLIIDGKLDESKININYINKHKRYDSILRNVFHSTFTILISTKNKTEIKNALNYLYLDENVCDELSKLSYKKDRGSFSLKEIDNLLPLMNGEKDFKNQYESEKTAYGNAETKNENFKIDFIEKLTSNDVRNPLVKKVINKTIESTNSIIEYLDNMCGKDNYILTVNIEMQRELCLDKDKRKLITNYNKNNEKYNDFCKKILVKINHHPSLKNTKKVKLFIEQIENKPKNIYSDDFFNKIVGGIKLASVIYNDIKFNIRECLNSSLFNFEHTMNKADYNSDDLNNLTICDVNTNQDKKSRTAYDYINTFDDNRREKTLLKIKTLYSKRKQEYFSVSKNEIADFYLTNNQLTITSYISKLLSDTLTEKLGKNNVKLGNGTITNMIKSELDINANFKEYIADDLNKKYSFNNKFQFDIDKLKESNLLNKRLYKIHHALDAMILSFVDDKLLFHVNNKHNKTKYEIDLSQKLRISSVFKKAGLTTKDKLTDDEIKELKPKFWEIVKNELIKCQVILENKENTIFEKNKCVGVNCKIHEETIMGRDEKTGFYILREPYQNIYETDKNEKLLTDIVEIHGVTYEGKLISNKYYDNIRNSKTFYFKDKNGTKFIYHKKEYDLNDYILCLNTNKTIQDENDEQNEQKEKKPKNKYIDVGFEEFLNKHNIKRIKFSYESDNYESVRFVNKKPVGFALCKNKYALLLNKKTETKIDAKVISVNTYYKDYYKTNPNLDGYFMAIKQNQYYFIGLKKEDIINYLDKNDFSFMNNLFYINGYSQNGDSDNAKINMLKYSHSKILTGAEKILTKDCPKTYLSNMGIQTNGLIKFGCMTYVEFDNLGNIKEDSLKTYIF